MFCETGRALIALGHERDAEFCYRAALQAMLRAVGEREIEAALQSERLIYRAFVQPGESEAHYEKRFADWHSEFAALGARYRTNLDASKCDPARVAFFLHAGHLLGHTQVLLRLLGGLKAHAGAPWRPRIYVLTDFSTEFVERARSLGVELVTIEQLLPGGRGSPLLDRLAWLRKNLEEERFAVCIWVSSPLWSSFALSMQLAPVQIFWALRYHPVSSASIDGYLTWGAPGETTRRYGNQGWQVVPMPLALDELPPSKEETQAVRRRFPEPVLLGTLAREEKINSAAYLRAVCDILVANPQAGFVWTGHRELPTISAFFRGAGVAERCHFAGWVDTKVFAAALDVFLETFPVGSGVTSLQAFAAGTPLISYLDAETIFGTYYWEELTRSAGGAAGRDMLRDPERYPILCARDTGEYVALAGRLISDAAWRRQIGERGSAFYRDELGNNEIYCRRFFEAVARIAGEKLAIPLPDGYGTAATP